MKSHSNSRHTRRRPVAIILNARHRRARIAHSNKRPRQQHVGSVAILSSLFTHHSSRVLIGSAAIRIARNPTDYNAKPFSNRSKRACLCALFAHVLQSASHHSRLTTPAFLIASETLEIDLICSQQTRKLFLFASFSGFLAHAAHLTTHQSHLATRAFLAPAIGTYWRARFTGMAILSVLFSYRQQALGPIGDPAG
jgi:hypothetical protein